MRKRVVRGAGGILVALLVVLAVVTPLVAQERRTPPPGEPKVKAQRWQMGTAPVGGTFYTLGAAISKLANAKVSGLQIVAQVSPGSSAENFELLMARQIELGMSDNFLAMTKTGKPWKNVRLAFSQHANTVHFVVRKESAITSPADYRGKRVAVGNPNSGMNNTNEKILEAGWGIAFKDMATRQIHVAPGLQGIKDGQLDAVNIPTGVPVASILELARTTPLRFLSLTPDDIRRIRQKYPEYNSLTIPKGAYPGQDADVHTIGTVSFMLTHDQVDADAIYWLTRTVFENLAELKQAHPAAKEFSAENVIRFSEPYVQAGIAFHPGAARYFKEVGLLK
ncbi:MAG: TAXI family TRAP transporter solute-binding subunit [Candidatus Rokubacteria bacterium]|nr:TAXI family TRAP transporter solute-binding subunit [Candidatus Rokubacteria bacterium]